MAKYEIRQTGRHGSEGVYINGEKVYGNMGAALNFIQLTIDSGVITLKEFCEHTLWKIMDSPDGFWFLSIIHSYKSWGLKEIIRTWEGKFKDYEITTTPNKWIPKKVVETPLMKLVNKHLEGWKVIDVMTKESKIVLERNKSYITIHTNQDSGQGSFQYEAGMYSKKNPSLKMKCEKMLNIKLKDIG